MSKLLDELCDVYGILPHYEDIWGQIHRTSDDAKRALLAAMGAAAGSEEEAAASLLEFNRRRWQRPLPPVQVVREADKPYRIAISLPAAQRHHRFEWCLQEEGGAESRGKFSLASLQQVETCELDGQDYAKSILVLDVAATPGYHQLSIESADGARIQSAMVFIVAPSSCYVPPAIQGDGRVWGFAAQLYGVRSERNWGMGDLGDLRHMLEYCASEGASTVLLNPLHALFADAPEHASPYSPSSRACFNTLYLDLEAIEDYAECEEARAIVHSPPFQARLRALRAAELVDYRGVAKIKNQVLEVIYRHFRSHHLEANSERARAFRDFQQERGETLRKHASFEALQEYFRSQDASIWGWPVWPAAFRDQHAPEVSKFCAEHLPRVEYFEYLQWQASRQLSAAGTRSWELGLGIGIMLDLAVGVAEGGSSTWTRPDLFAFSASTGAPPDEINRKGQDWGLPPWNPHKLTELAYGPFIEMLQANMRDAGALRLDHVMGLRRLFWVARGLPITDGAYVAYPFEDLLGILALESRRNRCLVVGEDLGTVPDEIRDALRPLEVMSTRLLYFERNEDGRLLPPQRYPVNALAAVTTHDLPTLAGFWQGLDIELRNRLQLFPDEEVRNRQVITRAEDRAQLLLALESEGLLPAGSSLQQVAFQELTPELTAAVYTYLARAPSRMLVVQMEDAFGVREQPNLPGTTEPSYPSWRLKLPVTILAWKDNTRLQGIASALRLERPVKFVAGPAGGALGEGLRSWIPRATYRLQLHRDFNLRQAKALIAYLDALGISHCYLSPLLKARPGSRHGYDITDHSSLNPEIASAEEFEQFVAALRRHGMGQLMDVVPNHMGVMGADNGWWLDVLENGPASRFANHFDIDWYPIGDQHAGRVLLPILGDHYGAVLDKGELTLVFNAAEGSFSVFYHEHRLPIDPREYPRIVTHGIERLQARIGPEHPALLELQSLAAAFGHLPARDSVSAQAMAERARDKEVHKAHLASLFVSNADIAQFIAENIDEFNGTATTASPQPYDLMHDLLQAQAYRLAFWRAAADEINYRRFFDINDLAALRMENAEVFEATHGLIRELLARGYVNGLRIDHPDGLYEPEEYFKRLQAMAHSLIPARHADADDGNGNGKPLYVVVEKILASHEHLPESWPVNGTTGYDFAAACSGLFVDSRAIDRFDRIYQGFIRWQADWERMVSANKYRIMDASLAGELQVLATQLARIAKADRRTCDYTLNALRDALADIVASFPVYRTYVTCAAASADDVRYVNWAVGVAKKRSKTADLSILDFVRSVLLGQHGQGGDDAYRQAICAFAMRFQQYSSPVMAKAVEDTSFYQYNRLVSLNEVGAEPVRFGVSIAAFHRDNQERARRWPQAMLSSSTHDSKRSEDVRARISALSEMPEEWHQALRRWAKQNRSKRRKLESGRAPSRNDEYLFYQTLLGIWPLAMPDAHATEKLANRLETYMIKVVREAKVHSSWLNPDKEYEDATCAFVRALLAPEASNLFLRDFLSFQQRLAWLGALNSLSQVLLKLTVPGVPDVYQGNELWNLTLVDPDNRQAVDYTLRRKALNSIKALHEQHGAATCTQKLLGTWQDGRIKLYLIWAVLRFRRQHEALFRDGSYLPLRVHGQGSEHVCAFARQAANETIFVVVPRLFCGLAQGGDEQWPLGEAIWGDTWVELPADCLHVHWRNILNDEVITVPEESEARAVRLAQLFESLPFALLYSGQASL